MKHITKNRVHGFVLLDVLIAIAIISIVFIIILAIGTSSLNISSSITNINKADSLIREEIEAVRSFRDGTEWSVNGLGNVSRGAANPYHAFLDTTLNPNKWNLASGEETTGIFTRKVVFDNVSRDPGTGGIEDIYNGSHNDPDTVKITATVSWGSKTSTVIMYLTNWQN